ncbi:MAG: hypothetical protein V4696_06870 [Pseudomonadota bacterium]
MTAKRKPDAELTDHERAIWARFDAEIQKGLDDVEAGRLTDAEEVFDRLDAELSEIARRRA